LRAAVAPLGPQNVQCIRSPHQQPPDVSTKTLGCQSRARRLRAEEREEVGEVGVGQRVPSVPPAPSAGPASRAGDRILVMTRDPMSGCRRTTRGKLLYLVGSPETTASTGRTASPFHAHVASRLAPPI
jgi:hypothetical protein